ncbi:MAG: hypothetical protein LBL35_00695 [Clostridiales bacterium]|nr:hypothetical protein [Clostridiales bacterium]
MAKNRPVQKLGFDGFTSGFSQGNGNCRVHGRVHKDFADAALWKIRRADAGVRFRDRSNKPKRREMEILNRLLEA